MNIRPLGIMPTSSLLSYYTDSVAHVRHLYIFRSTNVVFASHGALLSVRVGAREARNRPSLGQRSRVLAVSKRMSEPCPKTPVGAHPAYGILAGVVDLPSTLSSQSSTITSLVTLGRRANSRMVHSRAASVLNNGQPALVLSRLQVELSILYFYNRSHMITR